VVKKKTELIEALGYLYHPAHRRQGFIVGYFLMTRDGSPFTVGRNFKNVPSLEGFSTPRGNRASRSSCYRMVNGLVKLRMLRVVQQHYSQFAGVSINLYVVDPEFLDFLRRTWSFWDALDYTRGGEQK
jgi:hypothetical protein